MLSPPSSPDSRLKVRYRRLDADHGAFNSAFSLVSVAVHYIM